jgi:hypothetical protein
MAAQSDKHARDVHRPAHVPPEKIAPVEPPQDARQAKKLGVMRYVLGVSLALVVLAFVRSYVFSV